MMDKIFIILGALNASLAVMLGAFGAHGLKSKLTADLMAAYETAVHYHLFHSIGLLLMGILAMTMSSSALILSAGWVMLGGVVLFSGSLYGLSISGLRWLGAITPIGGMALIISWILCAVAFMKGMVR